MTFAPVSATYYEAAILTPSGDAPAAPPVFSCHGEQAPPTCANLVDAQDEQGSKAMAIPLAALGNTPGRYAFKLRAHWATNDCPGAWSPTSPPVTVGPPTAVSGLRAAGSAGGATLQFAPAMRADRGYLIEMLDEAGAVVGSATVGAQALFEQDCHAGEVSMHSRACAGDCSAVAALTQSCCPTTCGCSALAAKIGSPARLASAPATQTNARLARRERAMLQGRAWYAALKVKESAACSELHY